MTVASVSTVPWASVAAIGSVAKASIGAIAGQGVPPPGPVKTWTTQTTAFSCDQILQLDASTLLIASGGGYWGGPEDPSFNHNPNMYYRKVLISDGSVVSSWDSTLNIWGNTAIDGDWIWQGVGSQTPFPQWDMWKVNHTTWAGIQRFSLPSPVNAYHPYYVFAWAGCPYVYIGDSGAVAIRTILKSTGAMSYVAGTTAWYGGQSVAVADTNGYLWMMAGPYANPSSILLKIDANTATLLASLSLIGSGINYITVPTYDPVLNCIWALGYENGKMVKIDCATNAVTWFTPTGTALINAWGSMAKYDNGKIIHVQGAGTAARSYEYDIATNSRAAGQQVVAAGNAFQYSAGLGWRGAHGDFTCSGPLRLGRGAQQWYPNAGADWFLYS